MAQSEHVVQVIGNLGDDVAALEICEQVAVHGASAEEVAADRAGAVTVAAVVDRMRAEAVSAAVASSAPSGQSAGEDR
jgi:hypothetical protein